MKIVGVLTDLFFGVKISDAAKRLGLACVFVKDRETFLTRLADEPPVVIFDLNCTGVDVLSLVSEAKAAGVPSIGFLSHVQIDLKQQAIEAGCGTVVARSAFAQNLNAMLEPYANISRS